MFQENNPTTNFTAPLTRHIHNHKNQWPKRTKIVDRNNNYWKSSSKSNIYLTEDEEKILSDYHHTQHATFLWTSA